MKSDFCIFFTIYFYKLHNFVCIVNSTISNQDNVMFLDLLVWILLYYIEDLL